MWMPSMMGRIYRNTLHNESQGGSCTFFLSMYSFKSEISRLTFFGLNLASVFYSYVVPDSGKLVSWGCLLNPGTFTLEQIKFFLTTIIQQ